jgi:predicted nucleotidyltransferase
MDVFGFQEAHSTAHEVILPGPALTQVVSLPALALLKVICWHDRHYRSPGKDAHDLQLILRNYLLAGNEARLWDEFADWTQGDTFDYQIAGARMLGHDMSRLLDEAGINRVGRLLFEQADPDAPGVLPREMNPHDPDRARDLLSAMLGGILERRRT